MNFSPDSRFLQFCGKLVALVRINLLWLLCCLPIFTIGAANTALFSALDALRREEDCGAKAFFAAFRKQFRRATGLWLVTAFLGAMLALDYRIVVYLDFPGRMAVICVICFCLLALLLVTGLSFPLLSRYGDTVKNTVVNAVLLTLGNLPKALLILSADLLPLLLLLAAPKIFVFLSFLLPLCGFSLIGLYHLITLDKMLAKLET